MREESGFTLPEMLVAIMIMIVVLFALYNIFDMSIRVFGFGNDKVEAVENARLGLERMERELRAAYPYDKRNGNNALLTTRTSNSVAFGNDLNGDRKIDASEQIAYSLSSGSPATLQRNGQPVVEFVQDVDGDGKALAFEYMTANGTPATNEADISMVRIKLEVAVDRGMHERPVTQILQTDVALRNRGG